MIGDVRQFVGAAVGEGDTGSGDQVLYGPGDEYLTGAGQCGQLGRDINRHAADAVVQEVGLAALPGHGRRAVLNERTSGRRQD